MAEPDALGPHIEALASGGDVPGLTMALDALLAADAAGYPQDLPARLPPLLGHADAGVALRSSRLAAKMAEAGSVFSAALSEPAFLEVLCAPLVAFFSNKDAYTAALKAAAEAAAAAAVPVKGAKAPPKGAPVAPFDLEASLPVASKQLLDATLSTLSTLWSSTPAAGGVDGAGGVNRGVHAGVDGGGVDALPGVAAALLALMAHHSQRVCWRAAKAAAALSQAGGMTARRALLLSDAPSVAISMLSSPSSPMHCRLEALRLLTALVRSGRGSGAGPALVRVGVPDVLVRCLISPETGGAPAKAPPPPDAAAAARPATPPTAGALPVEASPTGVEEIQAAAAALMIALLHASPGAAEPLLAAGAPNVLLALLPAPPPAPPTEGDATMAAASGPAPFFPPPPPPVEAGAECDTVTEGDEEGEPTEQPAPTAEEGSQEGSVLHVVAYPLPGAPATAPALHALLLTALSLLLANSGARAAAAACPATSSLVDRLAHFLYAPDEEAIKAAESSAAAAAKYVQAAADAAAAAKGVKPPSAKASTPTPGAAAAATAGGGDAPTLRPPFAHVTQGAALRCLVQLAREPGLARAIACHVHVGSLVTSTASAAPAFAPAATPAAAATDGASATMDAAVSAMAAAAAAAGTAEAAEGATAAARVPAAVVAPAAELLAMLLPLVLAPVAPAGEEAMKEAAGVLPAREMLVRCLKALAASSPPGSSAARTVAAASLLLANSDVIAEPCPPPASPPATPPPPPLATSQFLWDSLGRPSMTDGSNIKLVHI
ncbi:hypothetical protein FOA52_010835 [Chlamydomonas sp. UWO 241]|nr:hypothetical protein FOA52_010835 [Chlamydomonas sp. UWO 241]